MACAHSGSEKRLPQVSSMQGSVALGGWMQPGSPSPSFPASGSCRVYLTLISNAKGTQCKLNRP